MEDGHAPAGAELAVALDEEEEEAAPLVSGGRGAAAVARAATSQTRDLHLLSSAFLFVFLAYHAAQNLQSTVNTVAESIQFDRSIDHADAASMDSD